MTMSAIPYARQNISQKDIDAVVSVLKSDWIVQGKQVAAFEEALLSTCQSRFASATSNATTALQLTYQALGLAPGDALWTTPITYLATSNAALVCGASVDFVDINLATKNICPQKLEDKLKNSKKRPKILTVVHMAGLPVDLKAIHTLAKKYEFAIVEDASHALGATFQGDPIGDCKYSDATVFSFHPVKIITTGEGGAVLTNSGDLDKTIKLLRSHGVTRNPDLMPTPPLGDWYYAQIVLGNNYRMTDFQAALGHSQLERLKIFIERRRTLARQYQEGLEGLPLHWQSEPNGAKSAYHLFLVNLDLDRIGKSHGEIYQELHCRGILVNLHYYPVYLQPFYRNLGFKDGYCPNAETYYRTALSLPMYYDLSDSEQNRVIQTLSKVLE